MTTSINTKRCFGTGNPLYEAYHDHEWGVPNSDDCYLFEMLILEGAQAGLNWETILKRRDGYRALFHQFDPIKVAAMSDQELEQVLTNPAIIRNRLKVYSTRANAKVFLAIQKEFGSFHAYLKQFVSEPIINDCKTKEEVPVTTPISDALSKDLKKRGMSFVGSTIMYAFMQAIGLVNDHTAECFLRI